MIRKRPLLSFLVFSPEIDFWIIALFWLWRGLSSFNFNSTPPIGSPVLACAIVPDLVARVPGVRRSWGALKMVTGGRGRTQPGHAHTTPNYTTLTQSIECHIRYYAKPCHLTEKDIIKVIQIREISTDISQCGFHIETQSCEGIKYKLLSKCSSENNGS